MCDTNMMVEAQTKKCATNSTTTPMEQSGMLAAWRRMRHAQRTVPRISPKYLADVRSDQWQAVKRSILTSL
jgi:predicted secreted Zn-dependent protease